MWVGVLQQDGGVEVKEHLEVYLRIRPFTTAESDSDESQVLLHVPVVLLHVPVVLLHVPIVLLHVPIVLLHVPIVLMHVPIVLLHQ